MTMSLANDFHIQGFDILSLLTPEEFKTLRLYATSVLQQLFYRYANLSPSEKDILTYHTWGTASSVPHKEMLRAANRHMFPPVPIQKLLVNEVLVNFLESVGITKFRLWDEGLGWLAFRLIRPGYGDGYPFSCKNWGPAKNVFSLWIPLLGLQKELMLNLIPGSHLKEYAKYLPTNSQFTPDEYRLDYKPAAHECVRPLMQEGQAIIFHPRTLHAEEVLEGTETRFNLEFRIEPL